MSARIPELERELVRAARRATRPRRRAVRRGVPAVVAALVLAGGVAGASSVLRGEVGGEPTSGPAPPGAVEAGLVRERPGAVVLGGARIPGGPRFELVGYRLREGKRESALCLDVHVPPESGGYGCGDNNARTQGIESAREFVRLNGATEDEVRRVVVHYRVAGRPGSRAAGLTHVRGPVLRRIGVDAPFGFYVAQLPPCATNLRAQGFDGAGRTVFDVASVVQPRPSRRRCPRG